MTGRPDEVLFTVSVLGAVDPSRVRRAVHRLRVPDRGRCSVRGPFARWLDLQRLPVERLQVLDVVATLVVALVVAGCALALAVAVAFGAAAL